MTAPRVTAVDVKTIVETDLTDLQIGAFIVTANRVVEDQLVGSALGAETLKEIEQYLAAHFLSARDPQAQTEKIGGEYQVTYQGQTGMALASTHYGQTAMSLDTTGALAAAGMKRARVTVWGSNE